MASVSDIAKGFTISGLIDADARTRERFRVVEIPVAEIARRVEKALDRLAGLPADSIGEIMEADRLARMDNEE